MNKFQVEVRGIRNSFAIKKLKERKICISLYPLIITPRLTLFHSGREFRPTTHGFIASTKGKEKEKCNHLRSYFIPHAPSKYFPRNGTFLFARFTISARRRRRRCFRTATFLNVQFFFPPTRNDRWKVYSPLFSFPLYLLSKKERERSNKYSLPLYIKSI